MEQLGMALFGLVAMALALTGDAQALRWAPVVGLVGQAFWTAFAIRLGRSAWGLWAIVPAYTVVYAWGIWRHWA